MKRKFLYIGILLLVAGLAVDFFSAQSVSPSNFGNVNSKNFTLGSNSVSYAALNLNQSGVIAVSFNSTTPVSEYVINASAFGKINGTGASGATSAAASLEGKGVYEIYQNVLGGAYPFSTYQQGTKPIYAYNSTLIFPAGSYYVLFADTGASAANVSMSYFTVLQSKLISQSSGLGTDALAGFFLIVVGVIMGIASLFMKSDSKPREQLDAEAMKEYDKIERK